MSPAATSTPALISTGSRALHLRTCCSLSTRLHRRPHSTRFLRYVCSNLLLNFLDLVIFIPTTAKATKDYGETLRPVTIAQLRRVARQSVEGEAMFINGREVQAVCQ